MAVDANPTSVFRDSGSKFVRAGDRIDIRKKDNVCEGHDRAGHDYGQSLPTYLLKRSSKGFALKILLANSYRSSSILESVNQKAQISQHISDAFWKSQDDSWHASVGDLPCCCVDAMSPASRMKPFRTYTLEALT
jgi:hypothetical protein